LLGESPDRYGGRAFSLPDYLSMPVLNDTSGTHMKNSTMAANAYEVKMTDPIESGKELPGMHGQNTGGFELRASQESGTH
jgi:hypothetical protein